MADIAKKGMESRRLFFGGLFPEVCEADVRGRFTSFGDVSNVDIIQKRDDYGEVTNTFAYVNINMSEPNLKKCLSVYNKTKWKGYELKMQLAKEKYMAKLQREKVDMATKESAPPIEVLSKSYQDMEGQISKMKAAVPGTQIGDDKNWVVGKYGRAMPIVYLRKSGSMKIGKFDPSKHCHQLKKLKDDYDAENQSSMQNLSWVLEEKNGDRKKNGAKNIYKKSKQESKIVSSSSSSSDEEDFIGLKEKVSKKRNKSMEENKPAKKKNKLAKTVTEEENNGEEGDCRVSKQESPKKKENLEQERKRGKKKILEETLTEESKNKEELEVLKQNSIKKIKSVKESKREKKIKLSESFPDQRDEEESLSFVNKSLVDYKDIKRKTSTPYQITDKRCGSGDATSAHTNKEIVDNSLSVDSAEVEADSDAEDTVMDEERLTQVFDSTEADQSVSFSIAFNHKPSASENALWDSFQKGDLNESQQPAASKGDLGDSIVSQIAKLRKSSGIEKIGDKPAKAIRPSQNEYCDVGNVTAKLNFNDISLDVSNMVFGGGNVTTGKLSKAREGSKSEDAESEDAASEDAESEDAASEDAESEDAESEDAASEDAASEDAASEDSESEDAESEDAESEDAESEESSKEEIKDLLEGESSSSDEDDSRKLQVPEDNASSSDSDSSSEDDELVKEVVKSKKGDAAKNSAISSKDSASDKPDSTKHGSRILGSPTRKKSSEQTRLRSLDERQSKEKERRDLVKSSLQAVDAKNQKSREAHITFDSSDDGGDDDDDDGELKIGSAMAEQKNVAAATDKFGAKVSGNAAMSWLGLASSGESDEENEKEHDFSIKPQFEGAQGQRLFKLQQKMGLDERFRLDARFLDHDDDDEGTAIGKDKPSTDGTNEVVNDDENCDVQAEKMKALSILEQVLGKKPSSLLREARKADNNRQQVQVRYDPTRDDHNQYEIPEEASDDASESDNDADASKLREQANDEVEEVPVVSNEKFFEVATSLKDLFQTKSTSAFSFLKDDEESKDQAKPSNQDAAEIFSKKKSKYHHILDDTKDEEMEVDTTEQTERRVSAVQRFFFTKDDPRLQAETEDGPSAFFRVETLEDINTAWEKTKGDLRQDYKKKHKDALRRRKKLNEKRPRIK